MIGNVEVSTFSGWFLTFLIRSLHAMIGIVTHKDKRFLNVMIDNDDNDRKLCNQCANINKLFSFAFYFLKLIRG